MSQLLILVGKKDHDQRNGAKKVLNNTDGCMKSWKIDVGLECTSIPTVVETELAYNYDSSINIFFLNTIDNW